MSNKNIHSKFPIRKPYFKTIYEDILFISARILNLIDQIENDSLFKFLRFEDLNYIDFFASHPFLVFDISQKEYLNLKYYGFTQNSLEYINSRIIFSNIREKLKSVFGFLIAKNLVKVDIREKVIIYQLTDLGKKTVQQFKSDYYKAYRVSSRYILDILRKVNQQKKKALLEEWMDNSSNFLIVA